MGAMAKRREGGQGLQNKGHGAYHPEMRDHAHDRSHRLRQPADPGLPSPRLVLSQEMVLWDPTIIVRPRPFRLHVLEASSTSRTSQDRFHS